MALVLKSNSDLVDVPDHGFVGEEGGECDHIHLQPKGERRCTRQGDCSIVASQRSMRMRSSPCRLMQNSRSCQCDVANRCAADVDSAPDPCPGDSPEVPTERIAQLSRHGRNAHANQGTHNDARAVLHAGEWQRDVGADIPQSGLEWGNG